jgi:hypothetical protein
VFRAPGLHHDDGVVFKSGAESSVTFSLVIAELRSHFSKFREFLRLRAQRHYSIVIPGEREARGKGIQVERTIPVFVIPPGSPSLALRARRG